MHQSSFGSTLQRGECFSLAQHTHALLLIEGPGRFAENHTHIQRVLTRLPQQRLLLAADAIDYTPGLGPSDNFGGALKGMHSQVLTHALVDRQHPMQWRLLQERLAIGLLVILFKQLRQLGIDAARLHFIDSDYERQQSVAQSARRRTPGGDEAATDHVLELQTQHLRIAVDADRNFRRCLQS